MGDPAKQGDKPKGDGPPKNEGEPAPPSEPIDPKKAAEAAKAQKNQFALNRMILMLMDIDPSNMSSEVIEHLKQIYKLLLAVHANQIPKEAEEDKPKE